MDAHPKSLPDKIDPKVQQDALALGKFLVAQVVSLPKEDTFHRFGNFHQAAIALSSSSIFTFPDEYVSTLKTQFVDNEEEPSAFLRGYAAFLVAEHHRSLMEDEEALAYYNMTLNHCPDASSEGRKYLLKFGDNSVCEIVEWFKDVSEDTKFRLEDQHAWLVSKMKDRMAARNFLHPEAAEEFLKCIIPDGSPELHSHTAPTLNSNLIELVKGLPQSDKTYMIVKMEDNEFSRWSQVYEVIRVKRDRYRAGKYDKLFTAVLNFFCNNQSDSHQKNLLSAFALACQKPYTINPGAEQVHPPERPRQVLFETKDDATNPQVITFLSLMGCSEVDVVDPDLLVLLQEHRRGEGTYNIGRKMFSKKEPHMYDIVRGNKCGNCQMVGPQLKPCPCGKAYYCSKECQKLQWKSHKPEHKVAMKKVNGGN